MNITQVKEIQNNNIIAVYGNSLSELSYLSPKILSELASSIELLDLPSNEPAALRAFQGYKLMASVQVKSKEPLAHAYKIGMMASRILKKEESATLILGDNISADVARVILRSIAGHSWSFNDFRSSTKEKHEVKFKNLEVCSKLDLTNILFEEKALIDGLDFSRRLMHYPPNVLYPETFVKELESLKKLGIQLEILDRKAIIKNKMHMVEAVAQGSSKSPYVVVMKYNGNPKDTGYPISLVGKGVTFDSGGLCLKPGMSMEDMKCDMGGAAVAAGTIMSLAARKAQVNVVAVVGLVENMISGDATRPGDVVTAYNGKTVEIMNTDAEGRLVLGDVLSYTQDQFNPGIMINIATLTGAVIVALGAERSGVFSSDNELAANLISSGEAMYDRGWQLPIGDDYLHYLKSDVADIRNISKSRGNASAIAAAMFLKEFVDTNKTKWAHLDIAGTGFGDSPAMTSQGFMQCGGLFMLNKFITDYVENH